MRDDKLIELPIYPATDEQHHVRQVTPLKQLSSAQRDNILARIKEAPGDRDEIIEHVRQKGFDTRDLE